LTDCVIVLAALAARAKRSKEWKIACLPKDNSGWFAFWAPSF